jgi:hypothetical protein
MEIRVPNFIYSKPIAMPGRVVKLLCILILSSIFLSSCYRMRKSNGGGQIDAIPARTISPGDIAVPKGYKIEPVASGFTFPTACTFDDAGNLYVIEAGYSYGEVWGEPKLLRVDPGGKTTLDC